MPSIDLGNVMGPQGPQGSIWYQGTAITGTSSTATVFAESGIEEARVYDKYFNTGTNDIYTCVTSGNAETAEWVWIGNIRGGTGPIGPVGPTGSVDMNTPIEFTEAETMANIESGESVSTIFGKLKKVVGDLLAGAASTLLGKKLTESRALVSDTYGNVGVSTITSTELGYLDGVTKNIQEQFNEQNVNIEKLNGKMNGKQDAIKIDSSKNITVVPGITAYHVRCTKYGNMCIGYLNCETTKAFAAGDTIAVLPYPASEWTLILLPDKSSAMNRGSVNAGSTDLKIEQAKASGINFVCEFIWFTN